MSISIKKQDTISVSSNNVTTKTIILDAAIFVLTSSGCAGFTIEKVAKKARISPGNLTYHFKNKDLLITSLVDHWFCKWRAQYESMINLKIDANKNDISSFIKWVMDGALDDENVQIFTELWALSNHNEHVAKTLNKLYDSAVEHVILCLGIQKEDACYNELYDFLYFFAAVSEGSSAILGNTPANHPQRVIIKKTAQKILLPQLLQILERKRLNQR